MIPPHIQERIELADQLRRFFDLHIRKWKRACRRTQAQREREQIALVFKQYELVGGPRDGEMPDLPKAPA